MNNDRIYDILRYCLKENSIQTQLELANIFHVSQSTIRLDIERLEQILPTYGLQFSKKRGVGIQLIGSENDKQKALKSLQKKAHNEHSYQEDELEYSILLYLFQHMNSYVRIVDLANTFYVSESYIQKRLQHIKTEMVKHQIQLKATQNKGIKIHGSEEKVRKFFAKLMSTQSLQQQHETASVHDQIMDMLQIHSEYIFQGIRACEKELHKSFSDEARNALAIHIAIAIKRSIQHKNVPCHQFINQEAYKKEYQAALHLFEFIMSHYHIAFHEDEVYYVFLHLISAKVIEDRDFMIKVDIQTQDYAVQIAKDITALVNNVKQIQIAPTYVDNLILHLRPMMNRLEYGMELENTLLDEIKTTYPEAYGIAWMCNTIIRKYQNCELSEHEAGFLAMHIQAMIESNKKDINVVIVCSSGVGVSQLLATQLEKHFSRIHIASVDSLATFMKNGYGKEIDLVLSTFPLKSERPTLVVNPFLTNEDIQAIYGFIDNFQLRNTPQEKTLKCTTYLHRDWRSQKEVIHNIAKILVQNKEVSEAFEKSVYDREALNSTAIGMHVALPHASFETVYITQIVIVTLTTPILWQEDEVDFIMFVLVHEQDKEWANAQLKKIYRKLYDKNFHKELLAIVNEAEMIKKIQ